MWLIISSKQEEKLEKQDKIALKDKLYQVNNASNAKQILQVRC